MGTTPSAPAAPPDAKPDAPTTPDAPQQPPAPETFTVTEPPAEDNPPARPRDSQGRFTAEQIQAARREEKDKLYGRLQEADAERKALLAELEAFRTERENRQAAEAKAREEAEAEAKAKREAEMSAKSLLEQRTQEWEERWAQAEAERQREREIAQREIEYNRLRAYIQEKVTTERDNIAPELLDLVTGNTQEEVDASINLLKDKTAAILANVQSAQQARRSQMRGVGTGGYTTQGPMDNESGTRNLSAADIKNMSMQEYAKYRDQLLGAASDSYRQRGLFG